MNDEEEPMYDVFVNTHTEKVWVAKCLNANVAELLATNYWIGWEINILFQLSQYQKARKQNEQNRRKYGNA